MITINLDNTGVSVISLSTGKQPEIITWDNVIDYIFVLRFSAAAKISLHLHKECYAPENIYCLIAAAIKRARYWLSSVFPDTDRCVLWIAPDYRKREFKRIIPKIFWALNPKLARKNNAPYNPTIEYPACTRI
jgi:hypothetical protein